MPNPLLGPPVPFYQLFLWEGSPSKIGHRKKIGTVGSLILTSLLEDLDCELGSWTQSCLGLRSRSRSDARLGKGFALLRAHPFTPRLGGIFRVTRGDLSEFGAEQLGGVLHRAARTLMAGPKRSH